MTSIEVQGAVVVATMQDIAGRVYKADAPVLDGRGGLPSPLGRLASYLYRLAILIILIRPDDFLCFTLLSKLSAAKVKSPFFQSGARAIERLKVGRSRRPRSSFSSARGASF